MTRRADLSMDDAIAPLLERSRAAGRWLTAEEIAGDLVMKNTRIFWAVRTRQLASRPRYWLFGETVYRARGPASPVA